MSNFIDSVRHTIKKYNMIISGETVIVGVSGGADSVGTTGCACVSAGGVAEAGCSA